VEGVTARFRTAAEMKNEDWSRLLAKFNGNVAVEDKDISKFESENGLKLPAEYHDFLKVADGGEGFIGTGAYVILWTLDELAGLNDAYEVEEYAPGLFLFGSNGGGEAFAFDRRIPELPIVKVPFVGMELKQVRTIALTFGGFLKAMFEYEG
jgi:SMI1 / KNR4 family (SUKH-1)